MVKRVQNSAEDRGKWINIGGRLNGFLRLFSVRCIGGAVARTPDKTRNKRETIDGCADKVLIPFTFPDNVIGRAFKRPFDALETHRARRSFARSLVALEMFLRPQNATRGDTTTAINNRHGNYIAFVFILRLHAAVVQRRPEYFPSIRD